MHMVGPIIAIFSQHAFHMEELITLTDYISTGNIFTFFLQRDAILLTCSHVGIDILTLHLKPLTSLVSSVVISGASTMHIHVGHFLKMKSCYLLLWKEANLYIGLVPICLSF